MTRGDSTQLRDLIGRAEHLLDAGDARAAQACALEALALRPGNPEAKNLMGVSYYHDGAFGLACDIFDGLARQDGECVPLRINAGVAALRCQRVALALLHLRRAVDLDPRQKRAYAYLGLLHLQGGDLPFTSAALREAGLTGLADRVQDEVQEPERLAGDIWAAVASIDEPPALSLDGAVVRFVRVDRPVRSVDAIRQDDSAACPPAPTDGIAPVSAATQTQRAHDEHPRRLRRSRGVPLGRETGLVSDRQGAEQIDSVLPAVAVGPDIEHRDQRVYLRCGAWCADNTSRVPLVLREDLVLLAQGDLHFSTCRRRSRGGDAGPFTLESGSMALVDGEGVVVLECPAGGGFAPVTLVEQGDCLYLRESSLAAFSSSFHWENGEMAGGVPVVRLAGRGTVVIIRTGRLGRAWIDEGTPATVRGSTLLGWLGDVAVTPSEMGSCSGTDVVRCDGEGTVLVESGVVR